MNRIKLMPIYIATASAFMSGAPHVAMAAQGFSLEEVIVTARKTEEALQDVPVSVSTFTPSDLATYNITQTTQLAQYTPSLFIETNSANNLSSAKTTIRGQVQVDALGTVDPSVGWYIDDVYLARTTGTVASMFDLANVEVLKGPQGTLYGRNTTGGAIKLVTKKAETSGGLEGFVTGTIGNFGANKIGGGINIPIIDNVLAVRLTALSDKVDDGYATQTVVRPSIAGLYPGNPLLDFQTHQADVGQKDVQMYRASVTWEATDEFSIHLLYETSDFYANAPLLNHVSAPAIGYTKPKDLYSGSSTNAIQESWNKSDTASLTIDYNFTDDLGTKLVYGYRHMESSFISDVDGVALPLNYFLEPFQQNAEQNSLEWQVFGSAMDARLDWVTGIYYFDERGIDWSNSNAANAIAGGVYGATFNATIDKNRSRSIFFSGTLHLTDSVNFTGGLRYTRDSKPVSVNAEVLTNSFTGTTACRFDATLAPNPDLNNCTWRTADSYEYMSWTAGFDWKITADILTYIKSSNASRAGGQNLRGLGLVTTDLNGNSIPPINTFEPFDPETVTDIELGMKAQFFDHTLQVNTAYYHMWYDNVQKTALLPTPTGLTTFISNTSKATYDGFEIEAKWVITDQWMIQANAGLIDWSYEDTSDYSPSVPEREYSVRVNYRQPIAIGDLNFDVNYSYRGKMYPSSSANRQNLEANPDSLIDDVGLVGARVALDMEQYGLTIAAWGQNLTDERYTLSPLVLSTAAKLYATGLGVPRTYGVDLTYKF